MDTRVQNRRSDLNEWFVRELNKQNLPKFEQEFLELLNFDLKKASTFEVYLKSNLKQVSDACSGHIRRLLGRLYRAQGDNTRAILWTRKALTIFEGVDNHGGMIQCQLTLSDIYTRRGSYEQATHHANSIIENPSCDQNDKIKAHVNLGNLEHRRRRYKEAETHFEAALAFLEKEPNEAIEAIVLHNYACLNVCRNRFTAALENFARALALFSQQEASLYRAHVYQAMSEVYSIQGQFDQAEESLSQARRIYAEGSDRIGAAYCDLELFNLAIKLKQHEDALDRVDKLAKQFESYQLYLEKAQLLYQAAEATYDLGEADIAEDYLAEARRIFQREENQIHTSMCDLLEAKISLHLGFPQKAKRLLDSARFVFTKSKLAEYEIECHLLQARLAPDSVQSKTILRLRKLLKSSVGLNVRIQAQAFMATYWHKKRQFKRAITHLMESISLLEESRVNIQTNDLRLSYFSSKTELYETLIVWLFQWSNPASKSMVFQAIELSRSRELYDNLAVNGTTPAALHGREPTLVEINRLHERMEHLERRSQVLQRQDHFSLIDSEAVRNELVVARQQYRELRTKLRDHKRLAVYFPFDWDVGELQRRLPKETLLISYFMRGNDLYRLELDHKNIRKRHFQLSSEQVSELNLLPRHMASMELSSRPDTITRLDRISTILVPKNTSSYSHLLFIPHKQLQRLPFPALRHRGRYIIETHSLSQCPNLPIAHLSLEKQSQAFQKPLFFFSNLDSDPKAPERETLAIKYPQAVWRQDFVAPDLLDDLAQADLIHFAGHGYFNSSSPDASYLRIAGQDLSLTQIAQLKLNKPFVNLAACRSGALALAPGNELRGFVVSLFAAGSSSVLGGLWDIEDEATGLWMTAFYNHIDMGIAKAYQTACLAVLANRPEPYAWAGLALFGGLPN